MIFRRFLRGGNLFFISRISSRVREALTPVTPAFSCVWLVVDKLRG
jgi:hypothetical protein